MAWRLFYLLLMAFPTMLGQRNVRIGGDFAPAFVAGLILVLILLAIVELIAFGARRGRRPRSDS